VPIVKDEESEIPKLEEVPKLTIEDSGQDGYVCV